MSNKNSLENIKKLREMTGVGFKDCKLALDETKGNIEKSIEFLRKKGIAKASKKMSRTASDGLAFNIHGPYRSISSWEAPFDESIFIVCWSATSLEQEELTLLSYMSFQSLRALARS